jgi:hypothetical protein
MPEMTITRRAAIAVSMALAATASTMPHAAAAQEVAMAIKATYIVKFSGFVEWPPTVFSDPTSPLVVCVTDAAPFGDLLDRAAAGQMAGRHPIQIRRLPSVPPASGCHMLYVAGPMADKALAAVQGEPVLTVTDRPAGAAPTGIINFVVRQNRVRFEINGQMAAQSGLHISSQLMALAVNAH